MTEGAGEGGRFRGLHGFQGGVEGGLLVNYK